jgi:protein sidekick
MPGPPGSLLFTEITMTSVQVAWNPPEKPNGEIQFYLVTYKTAEPDDSFSKEVKQRVQEPHLLVTDLDEGIAYTFSVRAYTIGYGPASEANMTTGPQEGSPTQIESLYVRESLSAFSLSWTNGKSGRGPIIGYLVQAKRKGKYPN